MQYLLPLFDFAILFLSSKDLVDHTVLESLLRGHPEVTVSVSIDLLKRLAGMLRNDGVKLFSCLLYLLGGNKDVGCLSTGTAQ